MATLDLAINRFTTFGPIRITCKDSSGVPVPLAGYTAFAEIRKDQNHPVIIDLAPVIESDDSDGLITIPAIPPSISKELASTGARWDMILQAPDGSRATEPILSGLVSINLPITQPS